MIPWSRFVSVICCFFFFLQNTIKRNDIKHYLLFLIVLCMARLNWVAFFMMSRLSEVTLIWEGSSSWNDQGVIFPFAVWTPDICWSDDHLPRGRSNWAQSVFSAAFQQVMTPGQFKEERKWIPPLHDKSGILVWGWKEVFDKYLEAIHLCTLP